VTVRRLQSRPGLLTWVFYCAAHLVFLTSSTVYLSFSFPSGDPLLFFRGPSGVLGRNLLRRSLHFLPRASGVGRCVHPLSLFLFCAFPLHGSRGAILVLVYAASSVMRRHFDTAPCHCADPTFGDFRFRDFFSSALVFPVWRNAVDWKSPQPPSTIRQDPYFDHFSLKIQMI